MDKTNISINKIHWIISVSFSPFYTPNMAAFVQIITVLKSTVWSCGNWDRLQPPCNSDLDKWLWINLWMYVWRDSFHRSCLHACGCVKVQLLQLLSVTFMSMTERYNILSFIQCTLKKNVIAYMYLRGKYLILENVIVRVNTVTTG